MVTENLLSSARILMIDDDCHLRSVLFSQLRNEGVVSLAEAAKASEAFDQFNSFKPDLILLDSALPDGNGFDICQSLRARGFEKPIIMLISQKDETDINKGLDRGANEYIAKPIRFSELVSQIKTQLRQYKASDDVRFTAQNLEFQPISKTLSLLETNRFVVLTEKESMILETLFHIWPKSISRKNFLSEIWGYQNIVATHTLETHIYRLRQKISRLTEAPLVETTQDGYKLIKTAGAQGEDV